MYEGIFDDVREVEKYLKEAGIQEIDGTKIFNLLETFENVKIVTHILLESKDLNEPEASGSISRSKIFAASSDFIDDHLEEVEVIKEVRKEDKIRVMVDLTDNYDKLTSAKVENQEQQGADANWPESLTYDSNDDVSEDSNADDSMNQNDCDSDVENYYTTSDYEESNPNEIETDRMKAESPPPILSILKDLCENPNIPEQPAQPTFEERRQIENLEIMEENNNDPNNNNDLGEGVVIINHTVEPPPRPRSPVAGCSRDFDEGQSRRPVSPMIVCVDGERSNSSYSGSKTYFQDNMVPQPSFSKHFSKPVENHEEVGHSNSSYLGSKTYFQENMVPQPSCSKQFSQPAENHKEVVELDSKKSPQTNYEKLLEETEIINRLFPDISGDRIFSMLDKYKKATNRVQIVLWDLLPKERPEPNSPKKRKQDNDSYPNIRKKALHSTKIDFDIMKKIHKEVRSSEKRDSSGVDTSFSSVEDLDQSLPDMNNLKEIKHDHKESLKGKGKNIRRSCILQPAKLNFQSNSESVLIPRQKNNILSPPKLMVTETKKQYSGSRTSEKIPPKVLVMLPTKELSDEGFVAEGMEFFNTTPNIPEYQNLLNSENVQFTAKKKNEDDCKLTTNKFQSIEELNDNPVIKVRTDLFGNQSFLRTGPISPLHRNSQLPYQKNDLPARIDPAPNNQNNVDLENVKNINLQSFRYDRTYKLPSIVSPTLQSPQFQLPSMPSTSTANPIPTLAVAGPSVSNSVIKKTSEITEVPCKDTYYRLRGMFPNIDPEYIKEKCIKPPFDTNGLSEPQRLNMLVDELLTNGSNHHQIQEVKEESADMGNKDDQYENLLEIFPEADPTFLRDFVDKNFSNPDSLKDFVANNLENPSYPTREEYLKKVKITKQIKEYTTEFNIKKFLNIFPNPVAHFENPERTSEHDTLVYEFLKDVFQKYKVNTISSVYRKRKYNLSLTANELRSMYPDMKSKRSRNPIITEKIPLLQEMAYVSRKQELINYLEDVKRKEEAEFKELREKGMLLECQCCFNDECMPSKCSSCEKDHLFCHSCILRGTESKMSDGQNHISCFANCDSEFSLSVLQKILPPTMFSILLQKRQEAEVLAAGIEGLVSCPFCHFASIPPAESKVFKCLNPECMKETCRLCKELNHVPLKCDEVLKSNQARLQLEEKMTEALVRTCYKCQKPFFKEEGCNKMTCVCGASMCYFCSAPLENGNYSHFNGQGATSSKLCPLHSDNRRMNAEAVRKVAELTENEILKKNPNLKINAQAILPTLPPRTSGPHDDIPNANALPEYIRRVANVNP